MSTPSEVFKGFSNEFLASLAREVLCQEADVLARDRSSQDKAVHILLRVTGVKDMRTAERHVINCTRNEVFARWVALMAPMANGSAAANGR